MQLLPIIFSVALFGSAALSFSVQPILGKMLLPMVGGAPAGWIVAMTFFQLALLAGYGVSTLLGKFSPWVHAVGLILLYVIGFYCLPFQLPAIDNPGQGIQLSMQVIYSLFQAVFIPFLALTATTAAMQRIFAATKHETANDPYYLFAASNIGSFVGLLLYPFILEPYVGIAAQVISWRWIYSFVLVILGLCMVVAWAYRRESQASNVQMAQVVEQESSPVWLWLALSFVPCSLSMGVTTMITTDLGGLPLLWILPLGLYLLTFVLAFARKRYISTSNITFIHHVAVAVYFMMSFYLVQETGKVQTTLLFSVYMILLLGVFFMIAWACHDRLASLRPTTKKLPLYYLYLALGGGLAGVTHTFFIPNILNDVYEYSIVIALSLLLSREWSSRITLGGFEKRLKVIFLFCLFVLLIGASIFAIGKANENALLILLGNIVITIFFVSYLFFCLRPRYSFVLTSVLFFVIIFFIDSTSVIFKERNFFGSFNVKESVVEGLNMRYFSHGTTLHGMAVLKKDGKLIGDSFGYYLKDGPISHVLAITKAKEMAILGLGTGQLACFADKKITTDFFEIDSDVVVMAEKYFPYLKDCPPRDIVMGDGRIEIGKSTKKYDVILQDAFTSDGIPTHLLTHEAFEIYKTKLSNHGMVLFHISNRYFDLAPPIGATAALSGFKAYSFYHEVDRSKHPFSLASRWVAVTASENDGKTLEAMGWAYIEPAAKPWTDNRSSLLEAIVLGF